MTEPSIVDTDVLIDVGRNIKEAIASLAQIEQQSSPTISVVTQMELLIGCRSKAELRKLKRFLQLLSHRQNERTNLGQRSRVIAPL